MGAPKGFWASLWTFRCTVPFFIGLRLPGNSKDHRVILRSLKQSIHKGSDSGE
ncbi:hypothetical protein DEO72_LG9g234 [Vigna unguiculata]|uniref:Uncharacterized protein n=1 Tax=Vigna unguiculata TaxID=3917 RepID=A0A4D6MX27_VIGUN|nr:hypothetical protein DEO72_LG9g234 [Vigna unguiculata]